MANADVFSDDVRSALIESTYRESTDSNVDFGIRDERGRSVGVIVSCWQETYAPVQGSDPNTFYRIKPGTYFVCIVQPARNGHGYGSSQSRQLCRTEAERAQHIEKAVASTRRRYERKYGQVAR